MNDKYEIWKWNKEKNIAIKIIGFTSQKNMDSYLNRNLSCPENKDGWRNGWHEWNDAVAFDGITGIRSVCDFCGLMIRDVPDSEWKAKRK